MLRLADQVVGQRSRLEPAVLIELAELRDRLLNYLAPAPYRAHQTPVRVRLAVLAKRRVPQVQVRDLRPQDRTRKAYKQRAKLALHRCLGAQHRIPASTPQRINTLPHRRRNRSPKKG